MQRHNILIKEALALPVQPMMMYRRLDMISHLRPIWVVLIALLALAPFSATRAADTLRVEQVTTDVLQHSNQIAAARYMEEAAKVKIGAGSAWDDPMLMLGLQNVPTSFDLKMDPMTMKMIGLSQNIPLAGQKGLATRASREEAQAASEDRMTMQVEEVASARSAYADLYYRSAALRDLASQYDLLQQIVEATRSQLIVNQSSQEEYLAAQAEMWRMQSQLLMADHDVSEKWLLLQVMRGMPQDSIMPPLEEPLLDSIPRTPDGWIALAKSNYPALKKLASQSRQYGFEAQASNRMRWPMLNLQASYGIRSGNDAMTGMPLDNMYSFQAGISLPLFSAHQQNKMARSMQAMRTSSNYESSRMAAEIEARIRTLHEIAVHSVSSVALYRNQIIPADEDALNGAMAGYAANRMPLTSLLSYALNVYRDRIAARQLANQLAQAMTEISKYIGDPSAYAAVETPDKN
jgi:outer membrane protein TolC